MAFHEFKSHDTPFAVLYEKIRMHLPEMATNSVNTGRKNGFTNVCERCKYVLNLEL